MKVQQKQLCVAIVIVLSAGCGGGSSSQGGSGKQPTAPATSNLDSKFTAMLEKGWNYYLRQEIFLGPTYFGNTTSFGRHSAALHALQLMSDYPTYRALATKGLITLSELSVADAPAGVFAGGGGNVKIERAATVALTESGSKAGSVDRKANTVTFVLGTYRVEKITLNEQIATPAGEYRIVEGTHVLDIDPAFSDIWAELGWPTYRERRFRVFFEHTTDPFYTERGNDWKVAVASNGRFSAEDKGPRSGNFESENVPPTLDQLRKQVR